MELKPLVSHCCILFSSYLVLSYFGTDLYTRRSSKFVSFQFSFTCNILIFILKKRVPYIKRSKFVLLENDFLDLTSSLFIQ